jgi:glycosyltransferase involved in cell wall biosynthesis
VAEAILRMAEDEPGRRRMGEAARRAAERSFDRRQLAAEMLQVMHTAQARRSAQ